jgi:hypothetical protein
VAIAKPINVTIDIKNYHPSDSIFGLAYSKSQMPLLSIDRLVIRGPEFDEDEWCFVGPLETLSAEGVDGQSLELAAGEFPTGMLNSFAEELTRECERQGGKNIRRAIDT